MQISSVYLYKGQVSIASRYKTGYVSQETRPKFSDSQNFYFHFHYKLFCIKVVHLSYKLSIMWYMYRSLCP